LLGSVFFSPGGALKLSQILSLGQIILETVNRCLEFVELLLDI
jgi:hypothetical protein